jgi:hypothetical protein
MIDDRDQTGCGTHLLDRQCLWPDGLTGCRVRDGARPRAREYLTRCSPGDAEEHETLPSFRPMVISMLSAIPAIGEVTALDCYVAAPDPIYRYELIATIPGDGMPLM